jgi:hypothetical protein
MDKPLEITTRRALKVFGAETKAPRSSVDGVIPDA